MRGSKMLLTLSLALVCWTPLHAQDVLTGEAAFGTWEPDAPGVRRLIKPSDLPAPSHADNDPEAPDFENMAEAVPAPEGAMPEVPEGFQVEVFATGLNQPRVIRIAPNGDIFVAETGLAVCSSSRPTLPRTQSPRFSRNVSTGPSASPSSLLTSRPMSMWLLPSLERFAAAAAW